MQVSVPKVMHCSTVDSPKAMQSLISLMHVAMAARPTSLSWAQSSKLQSSSGLTPPVPPVPAVPLPPVPAVPLPPLPAAPLPPGVGGA